MADESLKYEYISYPRFEDMDSYGVLHHSRYLVLIEEAKMAFMQDPDFFGMNILEENVKFLISELEIRYIRAIQYTSGVPAIIKLVFSIEDEIKILFDFEIYYKDKLSCKGTASHIVTDSNNHLKLELPDELVRKYQELIGDKT